MKILSFPGAEAPANEAATAGPLLARLPVAPKALARVRWAVEARPQPAIAPVAAVAWLAEVQHHGQRIGAVACDGPEDPLATPGFLFETLALIRRQYPELPLEVATLGLGGNDHARQLAALGVRRITLLVDAVTQDEAAKVYAWVRPGTKTMPLAEATALLVTEQARAAMALSQAGMTVHIQTTVCPGINDGQVEEIARKMASLGAATMTLLPAHAGSDEDAAVLARVTPLAAQHLPMLAARPAVEPGGTAAPFSGGPALPKPTPTQPNVAVVSIGGMEVDLHLGHAIKALIYGPREDGLISLLAIRELPEPGSGQARWEAAASILHDCFALLAASAGESPKKILASHGINLLITEGEIDATVDLLYGGGKKGKGGRNRQP